TKTVALVAGLEGTIVGAGRGGCANIYGACGADAALSAVAHAVTAALSAAGVPASALLAGAFSMSGADWPEDMVYLREVMARRGFGATVLVVNDALGALRAGSPDGTGVAVVCGTGAAIGARAADGRAWHSGFWAESGGSHDLARKTLRAVYR